MSETLWHLLIVILVSLGLRLMLLGDQPYSDEGVYAGVSYFLHLAYTGNLGADGWRLFKDEFLGLYPLLSSWVYFLPWEPFFLLRSFDALFAAAAAAAVYWFLADAIGERRIALVSTLFFVLGGNHPRIIDAGYKNPILVATLMTALALVALQRIEAKRCYAAGLCMTAAVLLREPFLPMGIVVSLYAMARGAWSCLWRYAVAGALLALGIVFMVMLWRGDGAFSGLITAYTTYSGPPGYRSGTDQVLTQGAIAAQVLLALLPAAGLGLIAPALHRFNRDRRSLELYLLGLGLTLAPAIEVAIKPAYPYHFAQAALGLTILSALGLRLLVTAWSRWYRSARVVPIALGLVLVGANLLLLVDYTRTFYWQVSSAIRFVPVMVFGNWASDATNKSVYLRAARTIRENTHPAATLLVSTYARGLLPLTGRRPAGVALGNLTRVLLQPDAALKAREMERLLRTPPDVLVLMQRTGFFASAFVDHNRYAEALSARYPRRIYQPPGLTPYGGWSAEIFLR